MRHSALSIVPIYCLLDIIIEKTMNNYNSDEKQKIYEKLFVNYFEELCAYAYSYTTNIEQAKDIVQEAFLSLWQSKDIYELSKELLVSIVKRKSIDYLRSSYHNKTTALDSIKVVVGCSIIANQEEILYEKDSSQKLLDCMGKLPPQCNKIFSMSRKNLLKNYQIADELHVSIKAIEKQITKALKLLRECFERNR